MANFETISSSHLTLKKTLRKCLKCQPRVPIGLPDVSGYPELFVALLDSGDWAVDELKKLAGLNFLRVFRAVEKVGHDLYS